MDMGVKHETGQQISLFFVVFQEGAICDRALIQHMNQ